MRSGVLLVGLLLVAPPCGAQLVENGTFTFDVSGWPPFHNGTRVWDPMDAENSGNSGSCLITSQAASPGDATGTQQCIEGITGGEEYFIAASTFYPGGQSRTGWTRVLIRWYSDWCDGTQISNTITPNMSTTDQWVRVGKFVEAPANAVALALRLDVWKIEAGGELSAHFDNVTASEVIFRDDFEDGDLAEWVVSLQ